MVKVADLRGVDSIGDPIEGSLEVLLMDPELAVVVAKARDIVVQDLLLLFVRSVAEFIKVLVIFLQELVFNVGNLDT